MNALTLYRMSHWCYIHKIPILPKFFSSINTFLFSCKIPYYIKIGNGTKFAGGGMCLNLNVQKIGDNCRIGTMCVGMRSFPYKELPIIGNNVYISHGVMLVGPVIIGDNSLIAANSVVTKSIPENAIVAGIPAKIIGYTTDLDYNPLDNPKYKDGYKPFLEDKR